MKNLADLKDLALGKNLTKKSVKIDGEEVEFYIRKLSYKFFEENQNSDDDLRNLKILAFCLVDEKGEAIFTLDEIKSLTLDYFSTIFPIVMEESMGKISTESESKKTKKSGSNSSLTESVEEQ